MCIKLLPKYFGEYCFDFGVICAINTCKNGIFRQLLVPRYFGEDCVTFRVICACNTNEDGIFRCLLVTEDFKEYSCVFGVICVPYARENGIFWQLLVPKYFGEYWFGFGIIHAVNTHENGILICLQYNINCQNVIFSHVLSAHIIPNTKRYSPEYFGTKNYRNIPFLCLFIAHITRKAELKYFGTNSC